ncbi:hypothetical protein EMIT0P253_100066 [Pseudomonas sp. IT-P253]
MCEPAREEVWPDDETLTDKHESPLPALAPILQVS